MSRVWIIICFIFGFMEMAAQSIPDEVVLTFQAEEKPLSQILLDLSNKSGVNISFSDHEIPSDTLVSIYAISQTLGQILNDLLRPSNLNYRIVGDQLAIYFDKFMTFGREFTMSGFVEDKNTGERMAYAHIYIADHSVGTQSNAFGFFSLQLPPGIQLMQCSYLGYSKLTREITLTSDTSLLFRLEPNLALNEILVLDHFEDDDASSEDVQVLAINQISTMPTLGGESDLMRFTQMQAGVSTGSDGFGGMHVRGGEVDQNLILLDGVPIYNAGHALGIFSVFNPNMIKSARLLKNGFPARYGGRLSSVLDVYTREGNNKNLSGDVGLGTAAMNATIEGPLIKDSGSFLLSGRRTFLDPWIREVSKFQFRLKDDTGAINYFFYDFNGKLNLKAGDKNQFFINFYTGADDFDNRSTSRNQQNGLKLEELNQNDWHWGNTLGSIKWSSMLGFRWFSNLTLYVTQFQFQLFDYDRTSSMNETSGIDQLAYTAKLFDSEILDYGIRQDVSFLAGAGYMMRFGIHAVNHRFQPGVISVNQTDGVVTTDNQVNIDHLLDTLNAPELNGSEISLYLENDIEFGEKSRLNLGVNSSLFTAGLKKYYLIEPRFSMANHLGNNSFFKMSFTFMNQYLHLLTNSGFGLPNSVWLPSTEQIRPQRAIQGSVGLNVSLGNEWFVESAAYYKKLDHILSYPEGRLFTIVDTENWEEDLLVGKGEAYGLETGIRRNLGKFTTWMNYTLSYSNRQFDEINNGESFAYPFDRRHNFNLSTTYRFNNNAEFSFNWVYGTGTPITVPTDIIQDPGVPDPILVYGARNNASLKDYHRLDIAFNFYNSYSWGHQKISIGLYNSYNRRNPVYQDIRRNTADLQQFEFVQISIFPILPSLSYRLAF